MNFFRKIRLIEWVAIALFLVLVWAVARNGYLWHLLISIMIMTLIATAIQAYRNIRKERVKNSR